MRVIGSKTTYFDNIKFVEHFDTEVELPNPDGRPEVCILCKYPLCPELYPACMDNCAMLGTYHEELE